MTFFPSRRYRHHRYHHFIPDNAPFSSFIHPCINIVSGMKRFYIFQRARNKSSFCNSSLEMRSRGGAVPQGRRGEIVLLYYEVGIITSIAPRPRPTVYNRRVDAGEEHIKLQTSASGDDNGVCIRERAPPRQQPTRPPARAV